MQYLYECEECGKEQEIDCKMEEMEEQRCQECDAPSEKMKHLINLNMKTYQVHLSASKWKIGLGND